MIDTFSLIFSLSRSGSTALFRALQLASGGAIAYEPDYGESWTTRDRLFQFYDGIRTHHIGVKHVWDPNGSPFVNTEHRSSLQSLQLAEKWCNVNKQVLQYSWDRILFVRRRGQLARTLSDFLGQQTELWGHAPKKPHSRQELVRYRQQIGARTLAPVDLDVLAWYLINVPRLENELLMSSAGTRLRVVEYEQLFGSDIPAQERLQQFESIAAWLGFEFTAARAAIESILAPDARYNDEAIFNRIPNIAEVKILADRIANA